MLGRIMMVNVKDTWDRVEALKPFEMFKSPLVLFLGVFCFCFLFLIVLGLGCCTGFVSNRSEWQLLSSCTHELLIALSSLVTEHELYGT